MATSPVRIRDEDKAQLERLRQAMLAATGEKPTQQEAMGKALEFALRHRDRFVAEATWTPLTRQQFRKWVALVEEDEGFEAVPAEQIDDVVYGA
ncbi:MAG TPA: hypothetical protein VGR28_10990 [Candidatus Thermoplasmatota archaeon]|nr:hypothetical protein [Candidatus Thermoplasmatota archaeon]